MNGIRHLVLAIGATAILTSCATPLPPGAEPGPDGTMAYSVLVEASDPGARIEVDGDYVGETPVQLKVFGDRDGTFHDFGAPVFTVRASPIATNHYPQTRIFQTGHMLSSQDKIPGRIYFDMNRPEPVYVPVPVYVTPRPSFYYGQSYYLGPGYYQRPDRGLYRDPRYTPHVTPPLRDQILLRHYRGW